MHTNRNFAFTLIELLGVIVVMGIVFAVGLPAFYRFSKSAALPAASRQLTGTLRLARQYAITHREHTFVVFPFSQTTSMAERRYTSYSVVSRNGNSGPVAYVNKWEKLPNGVVFLNDAPRPGPFAGEPGCDLDSCLRRANLTITGDGNYDLAFIEFTPTGAARTQNNAVDRLTLVQGFVAGSIPNRTSANYVNIFVEPVTGRIRTERP
jgi:Tfp pilus assembly protein FimT